MVNHPNRSKKLAALTDAEKEARQDHIARAWNAAYERASPPDRAYDEAERAGKIAAKAWDRDHAAVGQNLTETGAAA